jgi:hypothetical protein
LSEPCGYPSPNEFSPERKVQFANSETRDTFDIDGLKDRKKRLVLQNLLGKKNPTLVMYHESF